MRFSHFDDEGKAKMVDVSQKNDTYRIAKAYAKVIMKKETLEAIVNAEISKGDVFTVAKIAGIHGVKKTSDLIPLCHNIFISNVDIDFSYHFEDDNGIIEIFSFVSSVGKTGVEMEALTAVSISALTIYDMCKAVDKGIEIKEIYLLEKRGGKSGTYKREKKSY